jgi:hypothetical protein
MQNIFSVHFLFSCMDIKKTILSFQVSDKFVTITRVELSVNADFLYKW